MSFHEVQFPTDISRNARGGPMRRTQIITLASGKEERNASWADSRRKYDAAYGIASGDDLSAVIAFFEARNGRAFSFRWKDWADYKSCLPSEAIAATDQTIGTGDGVSDTFQLSKKYISGLQTWSRVIAKPVAGTVLVAVDSVTQTSGYLVDETTGHVYFAVPPTIGAAITSGFEYDVPVRFDTDQLDVNSIVEMSGAIASVPMTEDRLSLDAAYTWSDIFVDQTALGGEDWTGFGTTTGEPAEAAIEFFMETELPTLKADGAKIILQSPTGTMHLRGRMQPPPRSILQNWTLDLGATIVERGKTGPNWGMIYLWGLFVEASAGGLPTIGVDAVIGDTTLTLTSGASSDAFVAAAGPGSVCELRTDATSPNYHPETSRQVLYISSVATDTVNLTRPLEINAPVSNPLNFAGEVSDPSTLTLLVGSTLASDAVAGATSIVMDNAEGIVAGDWVYLSTSELPNATDNQFATLRALLDPAQDFGGILMNEEIALVASVSGNTLTLAAGLGKNKLTAWNAACVKIDPIENCTLTGGVFVGQEDHVGTDPWEHQYLWARYVVNSTVNEMTADKDATKALTHRRQGQAVRMDTGYNNRVADCIIGQAGGIDAGVGYGVSLRRGERETIVSGCDVEKCRHSIELWSTSGGCIVEDNVSANDTSSAFDTHGSWNTNVIIRRNTASNDGLLLSPDLGGLPDAFRCGNNKFWYEDGIRFVDNVVSVYRGNAISVVPGAQNVTCTGLVCNDVDRVVKIAKNNRHPDLYSDNVLISSVTADDIRDRICEVDNVDSTVHVTNLTYRDWLIGGSGLGTIDDAAIENFRVRWADDVIFDNVRVLACNTQEFLYVWDFEDCDGVTFTNCFSQGGERGLDIRRVLNLSGDIEINLLEAASPIIFREVGTCSGAITLTHDDSFVPVVNDILVTVTLVAS